jgi:hypothetical protein
MALAVEMLKFALQQISDSLKATVRMVWGTHCLVGLVGHRAHVIEHQERINPLP